MDISNAIKKKEMDGMITQNLIHIRYVDSLFMPPTPPFLLSPLAASGAEQWRLALQVSH